MKLIAKLQGGNGTDSGDKPIVLSADLQTVTSDHIGIQLDAD